nr:immunoglobulin heavy chain junction region [Mus musculus]MBK4196628.1 immunoglobulin heavy chain junction region [Mus musculus]
CARWGYKW